MSDYKNISMIVPTIVISTLVFYGILTNQFTLFEASVLLLLEIIAIKLK